MLKSSDGPEDERKILSLFERLALEAGRAILAVRDAGFSVEQKADQSPVTQADTRAEALIREGIRHAFPGLPLVAEEQVSAGRVPPELGDTFVLIDPLDGTREFIAGRTDFTVNIALVHGRRPAIGVVLAPARGVMFGGRPGKAEKIVLDDKGKPEGRCNICVQPAAEPLRIVASRSHRTAETDTFIAQYSNAEIVPIGSSLKFCLLASAEADLYPRFGRTMEWDTAAGDAILRAAGGMTVTLGGAPLAYGKRNQKDDADFANPWFIARGGTRDE